MMTDMTLDYCPECNQMTNHTASTCRECGFDAGPFEPTSNKLDERKL